MIEKESIQRAVELGQKSKHLFVATSDGKGVPHVAAAAHVSLGKNDRLLVSEWFCPGTLENLRENAKISVVTWDPERDEGYQVIGTVEGVPEKAVMDGFTPFMENVESIPQVERELIIKVVRIMEFSLAPHSDVDI